MAKVVKRFPPKLVWNHAQVKDKCEERKKKYITKKKIGVIENAPSKWCWFDCIDKNPCKHWKGRQFAKRDMGHVTLIKLQKMRTITLSPSVKKFHS
jgi:hypothetical protein